MKYTFKINLAVKSKKVAVKKNTESGADVENVNSRSCTFVKIAQKLCTGKGG